ncbi:hypothetical protein Q7P37_010977 [Cladosporium fusiforme]
MGSSDTAMLHLPDKPLAQHSPYLYIYLNPTTTTTLTKKPTKAHLKMARPQPYGRNFTDPTLVTCPPYLRSQAHWIRNTLDLQIAQAGPEALTANDLLDIDSFLRGLLPHASEVPLSTLRSSRIHLAVLDICGRATRWPLKVIERAEAIEAVWEARFGKLSAVGWDVDVEGWEEVVGKGESVVLTESSVDRARRFGDLGFKPGEAHGSWWTNPLFAYRAGMLDSPDPQGGVVADSKGAYAVLLTGSDEISSTTPEKFVYRSRNGDKGRYRLTAATIDSRHPVRILRSHTLRSLCYKVTSWSIVHDEQSHRMVYDITFKRLASEASMDAVLLRPFTEEIEDYRLYKKLRAEASEKEKKAGERAAAAVTSDGAVDERVDELLGEGKGGRGRVWEVYEDETAESPRGSVVVRSPVAFPGGREVLGEIGLQ